MMWAPALWAASLILQLHSLDAFSIEAANQKGTGRQVLSDEYVKSLQQLADKQNGSTVHRYDPRVISAIVLHTTVNFPGLVSVGLVIPESQRKTRSQHASTITEVEHEVLVSAWFGGTWERMGDVGIWSARYKNGRWGEARQVAVPQPDDNFKGWMAPCWNPVLLHDSKEGVTYLFYKVGINTEVWRGYILRSYDGGITWSKPQAMGPGPDLVGPAKNKPLILDNGTILAGSSDENGEWTCHIEISHDKGQTWKRTSNIHYRSGIIQPALFQTLNGDIKMAMRTRRENHVAMTNSENEGLSWSTATGSNIASPNSGIDAVTLRDGRVIVVHNDGDGRNVLCISMSYDNGKSYKKVALLESNHQLFKRTDECFLESYAQDTDAPEYSYPSVIQSEYDGRVHITYTYSYYGSGGRCSGRENVKHVIIDPCQLGDVSKAPRQCVLPQLRVPTEDSIKETAKHEVRNPETTSLAPADQASFSTLASSGKHQPWPGLALADLPENGSGSAVADEAAAEAPGVVAAIISVNASETANAGRATSKESLDHSQVAPSPVQANSTMLRPSRVEATAAASVLNQSTA